MGATLERIEFYRTGDAYGEFSNFAPFQIELDGLFWPTSEHYFQAQKFADAAYRETIRLEPSPMVAAKLGRDRGHPLRSDWEQVKDAIMAQAVAAKFEQHPKLRELLLATGDALLVEHTKNDAYWADGGDGTGQNKLGLILMEIRTRLRKTS